MQIVRQTVAVVWTATSEVRLVKNGTIFTPVGRGLRHC